MSAHPSLTASSEVIRLWRVYKTLMQMVHDRGYMVTQEELDMDLSTFCALATTNADGQTLDRDKLSFVTQKRPVASADQQQQQQPPQQLIIFFPEDPSLGVAPIRAYLGKMVEQGVYRAIIVIKQSITPSAAKVCASMAPKYILEQFTEAELVVNITEHKLVPKHIVLSEEEKKELLLKYHLKENQLPRILITDPVARYYGLRRGQVVKIVRPSETAGRYVTYRLVM